MVTDAAPGHQLSHSAEKAPHDWVRAVHSCTGHSLDGFGPTGAAGVGGWVPVVSSVGSGVCAAQPRVLVDAAPTISMSAQL